MEQKTEKIKVKAVYGDKRFVDCMKSVIVKRAGKQADRNKELSRN